jgi:hypothetical protein
VAVERADRHVGAGGDRLHRDIGAVDRDQLSCDRRDALTVALGIFPHLTTQYEP